MWAYGLLGSDDVGTTAEEVDEELAVALDGAFDTLAASWFFSGLRRNASASGVQFFLGSASELCGGGITGLDDVLWRNWSYRFFSLSDGRALRCIPARKTSSAAE